MKAKNQLTIMILVAGLLVTGIVYGDDPVKGAGSDATTTGSGTNLGWQEKTARTPTLVTDGLKITSGPTVGTNGVSWSIILCTTLTVVDCCKPVSSKESWCNFNADDQRCPD